MPVYAAYTRVSRVGDRADTLISPQDQLARIQAWAASAGHEIIPLPAELDQSGGRDDRPILLDAIRMVEAGEADGIAVAQLDRLSRSTPGALDLIARVERAGGQVRSVAENLDTATAEGEMVRTTLLAVATMERRRKADEFDRAKAQAIAKGIHVSGRVPAGYVRGPDRRLIADPAAAGVIGGLFDARAAGASWAQVAALASAGLGRQVTASGAARIIANPAYLGEARQGRHRNPSAHEPLVTREQWEAANRPQPRPPRGTLGPALLAGLVRCAGCGYVMAPDTGRSGRTYACRARHAGGTCQSPASISARKLDPHVQAVALVVIAQAGAQAADLTAALRDAQAALGQAERELAAYRDLRGQITELGAGVFLDGLAARVAAVDACRRDLAGTMARQPVPGAERIGDAWPGLTVQERRHVLRGALAAVFVRRGRGTAAERAVVIAAGHLPPGLPTRAGGVVGPVDADGLPGQVRAAGAQDVDER